MKKGRFKKAKIITTVIILGVTLYAVPEGGRLIGFYKNLPENIPKVDKAAAQQDTEDDAKYTEEIEALKKQIQDQQNVSSELKQKLNDYKKQEEDEKAKEKYLYTIVNTKLNEVGRTIVLDNEDDKENTNYLGTYKDGKWLTERELGYNIEYKFGISCDFSNGELVGFVEGNPIIKLPKSSIEIEYIDIVNDSLEFPEKEKDIGLFAKDFDEDDTKKILLMAKKNIEELIHNDREYFDKGEAGAEKYLKNMGNKFFKCNDVIVKFY